MKHHEGDPENLFIHGSHRCEGTCPHCGERVWSEDWSSTDPRGDSAVVTAASHLYRFYCRKCRVRLEAKQTFVDFKGWAR
jgi:hypothetical protein